MLVCSVLFIVPTLTAQQEAQEPADEPRPIRFDAFNVGEEFWFEVEAVPGRNPEITFEPGEQVEITLYNRASQSHNIRFGEPVDRALPILEPSRQDSMRFTVPEDAEGETQYWCEPHRSLGMYGTLKFGEPENGLNIKLPGPAPLGPLLVLLVFLWSRRPAQ